MNIRHLRFFVALAREGHYGRAAAACHVTQPTLSEAVRQLEQELNVPLMDRNGRRFGGLTPEGGRVLAWAREIVANEDALRQELGDIHGKLAGELRLGVIPAALPVVPLLTAAFHHRHEFVTVKILSRSSIEIERSLEAGELEGGLTYTENEPLRYVRTYPLYRERYMLLTPARAPFDRLRQVSWREAARLPLCLLTRNMQNRRIINHLFVAGGAGVPKVAVETDSVLSLVAHVRSGEWSSVLPHTFLGLLGRDDATFAGLRAIPLVEPEAEQAVGLVVSERDPLSPLARALVEVAQHIDLQGQFHTLLDEAS
jgi:DNA-binding transcriptional LysR family regulator